MKVFFYRAMLICFFLQFFLGTSNAQDTELVRLEYSYIPQSDGDNNYKRFRFSGNLPIPLRTEGSYLVLGLQYRNNSVQFSDELLEAEFNSPFSFQTYGIELGYTFKMKNNWRFGTKLSFGVTSDFQGQGLVSDDFRYRGAVFFVKTYKDERQDTKARLVMGTQYTTPARISFPLPIINYFHKFHPKWSYSLGSPKTSIKHYFNKKNTLQAFVGLDRFYSNLQKNSVVSDVNGQNIVAENISALIINNALGYEHYFTEHLLFYIYGGYTIFNEIRLRDVVNDREYIIDDNNTIYLRSGFKFKI